MTTASRLKEQLTALSLEDRDKVLRMLLDLREQEVGPDESHEWLAELDRRAEELRSGRDPGVPAEQVFAELRSKYGETNSVPAQRKKRIRQSNRPLRKRKARARTGLSGGSQSGNRKD